MTRLAAFATLIVLLAVLGACGGDGESPEGDVAPPSDPAATSGVAPEPDAEAPAEPAPEPVVAVPPASEAGPQQLLLDSPGVFPGVQADQLASGPLEEIDTEMVDLAATGTKFSRFTILWNQVALARPADATNPDDPAYDWSRIDRIACSMDAAGITAIVSTFSTPQWATIDNMPLPGGTEVNPWRPNVVDYGEWMQAVATRYNGGFVTTGPRSDKCDDGPLPRFRHYELWNEPHIEHTLRPQFGEDGEPLALNQYVQMTRTAYPIVKEANGALDGRTAIMLGGSGAPRSSSSETGMSAKEWMREVLRSDAMFDGYAQHIYPAAAPTKETPANPSWSTVNDMLAEIDAVESRKGMGLWITEAGYTTGRGARTGKGAVRTADEQARFLSDIFNLDQIKTERIPIVMWFNLRDHIAWPGGLLFEDKSPKPAYAEFKAVAESSPDLPEVLLP